MQMSRWMGPMALVALLVPGVADANWRNRDILSDPGPAEDTPLVLDSAALRLRPADAEVQLMEASGKRAPKQVVTHLAVDADYRLSNPTADEVAVTLVAHFPHRCDPAEQETPEAQATCHDDRAAAVDFLQLRSKADGKALVWKQGPSPGSARFAAAPGHTWLATLRVAAGKTVTLQHSYRVLYGPMLSPRVTDHYWQFAALAAWAGAPRSLTLEVTVPQRPFATYVPAGWLPTEQPRTVAGRGYARTTLWRFAAPAGAEPPGHWWLRASLEQEELKGIADFCPIIYDGSEGGGIEPTNPADLAAELTKDVLRLCRNWPSAKWGYVFADQALHSHFYRPATQLASVPDLDVPGPSTRLGLQPYAGFTPKLLTKDDQRDVQVFSKAEKLQVSKP